MDEQIEESWDLKSDAYENYIEKITLKLNFTNFEKISELFTMPFKNKEYSFLELACGSGLFANELL